MNVIVGIVDDVREDGIASSPAPFVYDCASAGSLLDPEYVVRTRGNPTALLRQIPQIIHGIDPTRAVFGLKMLDKLMDDALEQPRLNMRFLTIFASSAMLLASVGLYSLISMVVAARTREIGVRMALGAQPGRIAALVLADAGGLLLAGVLLGVIAALVTNRVLRSVLFGVSPLDPLTLTSAILVLVMVSTIAASVPARRAAAIDPLGAIRAE